MISRIRGTLLELDGSCLTVDAGGVGYEVFVPESVLVKLPAIGEFVDLRVRQIFREDGVSLYGFLEPFQRKLFDLLTEVKGCGPKIGLSILGSLGESTVVTAIIQGDAKTLSIPSGVGPRLAERIILELKDKVAQEAAMAKIGAALTPTHAAAQRDDELVETLVALGYRRPEAEAAARDVPEEGPLQERVKLALRSLAR